MILNSNTDLLCYLLSLQKLFDTMLEATNKYGNLNLDRISGILEADSVVKVFLPYSLLDQFSGKILGTSPKLHNVRVQLKHFNCSSSTNFCT